MDSHDVEDGLTELRAQLDDTSDPEHRGHLSFQLGAALLEAGMLEADMLDEAQRRLADAVDAFPPDVWPVEHATAANLFGAAQRLRGFPAGAAQSFSTAAALFEAEGRTLEQAAALHNLGLAERDLGHTGAAQPLFAEAATLFEQSGAWLHACAAARELGAALLDDGDVDDAAEVLEHALRLADRCGDTSSLGAAANLLGLAHLAAGRAEPAVVAFRSSAGAAPRSVRPAEHAMAKANLALAHEQAGDAPRARLAARQALGVGEPPQPVAAQAATVLDRLGDADGDLARVLRNEPPERRVPVLREELVWWAQADDVVRLRHAGEWAAAVAQAADGAELAEAWLDVLLELPPEAMDALVRATLQALAEEPEPVRESFHTHLARALPRFALPQWLRAQRRFAEIAQELGQPPPVALGEEPAWG
jgi:tetratricopeptide (TPR) repeat protein